MINMINHYFLRKGTNIHAALMQALTTQKQISYHIPNGIAFRLSNNSSNIDIFTQNEHVYEKALENSGNLLSFLLRCGTRPYERGTQ